MPDMTGPAISRVSNGDESHRRIRKLNAEIAVLSTFVGVLFACFVAVACKFVPFSPIVVMFALKSKIGPAALRKKF